MIDKIMQINLFKLNDDLDCAIDGIRHWCIIVYIFLNCMQLYVILRKMNQVL